MANTFLKDSLPRGIYARAALILIVPVVTIQLVVSVMFLQRHFEDVTRQMTQSVVRDLNLVRSSEVAPEALEISRRLGDAPTQDSRVFYDLSGLVVASELYEAFPDLRAVDLASNDRFVRLSFEGDPLAYELSRRRVSASNPHQLLVLMVVTAGVMTVVAFLFLKNQMRPIHRLARAAEAFGRGKSLAYTPSGAREVRAAGQAFLDMRRRIERFVDQRTLLLSGVSHDLRTPLTRMRLSLSMMEGEEVEGLLGDVKEMQAMIDAFLDFTRSANMEEAQRVDIGLFAREIAHGFARMEQPVELWGFDHARAVMIRPSAMTRAVQNLVKNAHRYGTRVAIHLEPAAGAIKLCVEDNGPGIDPSDYERASDPFVRLDDARNDSSGSVGLGLAVVRDVVRAHGGQLRLERSAALGGLRAVIVLPD